LGKGEVRIFPHIFTSHKEVLMEERQQLCDVVPNGEDNRFRIGIDELPDLARFGTSPDDLGQCHVHGIGGIGGEPDTPQRTTGEFSVNGHGSDNVMACPGN
jgi:hypothetical protein